MPLHKICVLLSISCKQLFVISFIICMIPETSSTPNIRDGTLALLGYHDNITGFVYLFQDGGWHPVCTYQWKVQMLQVLCVQLGFGAYIGRLPNATVASVDLGVNVTEDKYRTFARCTGW